MLRWQFKDRDWHLAHTVLWTIIAFLFQYLLALPLVWHCTEYDVWINAIPAIACSHTKALLTWNHNITRSRSYEATIIIGWANGSLTGVLPSISYSQRSKGNSSGVWPILDLHPETAIVHSPLIGYEWIEMISSRNTTRKSEATFSQHWRSTSNDLNRNITSYWRKREN